jgi:hypothetical protein
VNRGVLVAWDDGATFLLCAIRRADLDKLRLGSDGLGDVCRDFGLIARWVGASVGLLPPAAAWRIARDGITIRPLAEGRLRLVTSLAVRADSKSKLVNEFVKAAGRKLTEVGQKGQGRLPLAG